MIKQANIKSALGSSSRVSPSTLTAQQIIEEVRSRQRKVESRFVGGIKLSEEIKNDIHNFVAKDKSYRLITTGPTFNTAAERLLLRFEELCRRREVPISSQLVRNSAYRILCRSLRLNSEFVSSPDKAVTATLLNSELIANLINDPNFKPFLRNAPNIIRRLLSSNPANLRDELKDIKKVSNRILRNMARLRSCPGLVRTVATYHRNNSEEFLRTAIIEAEKLVLKPELNDFLKTRETFALEVVINYGVENALKFICNFKRNFEKVLKTPKYSKWQSKPGKLFQVMRRYPQSYKSHL